MINISLPVTEQLVQYNCNSQAMNSAIRPLGIKLTSNIDMEGDIGLVTHCWSAPLLSSESRINIISTSLALWEVN